MQMQRYIFFSNTVLFLYFFMMYAPYTSPSSHFWALMLLSSALGFS